MLKTQRLAAKDFPKLWTDHEGLWREMVGNAVSFLDRTLPGHERILADDLSEALDSLIAVNPVFVSHTEEQRLTQKYWSRDFADFIVDRIHPGPTIARGHGEPL